MHRYASITLCLTLLAAPAVADPFMATPAAFHSHERVGIKVLAQPSLPRSQHGHLAQESQLLSDIADGQLDGQSLMDAALTIGGVENESVMRRCQGRWKAFKTLMRQCVGADSDLEKATQLFRFMHQRILTGDYVEHCNAIDRALLDGDYNCVTATILFCCLAQECDLLVQPESLPGHVRCRVRTHQAGSVPLETTDPYWELAQRSADQEQETFADASGRSRTPSRPGRVLSDVEILAKLFYNRGLDELARGDFAAALRATELSWQLDIQHDAARDNVATIINNWALDLSSHGQYERALAILKRGQQLVPDHPILYANQSHIQAARQRQVASGSSGI